MQGLPRSTSIDSIILAADTTSSTAGEGAANSSSLSVSFASSGSNSPFQHPQYLQVMNPSNSRRESSLSPSAGRRAKPERGIAG